MKSLAVFAAIMLAIAAPAAANDVTQAAPKPLSFKECGAQYQAAKKSGALEGRKWAAYRKEVCRIATPANRAPLSLRSEATSAETVGRLAFPASLASEFSAAKPWEARMRTCLKGYHAAKKAGALYGIKWVQKGGGYYSLCAARLRGAVKA